MNEMKSYVSYIAITENFMSIYIEKSIFKLKLYRDAMAG